MKKTLGSGLFLEKSWRCTMNITIELVKHSKIVKNWTLKPSLRKVKIMHKLRIWRGGIFPHISSLNRYVLYTGASHSLGNTITNLFACERGCQGMCHQVRVGWQKVISVSQEPAAYIFMVEEWKWRQQVAPKLQYLSTKLHSVTFQGTLIIIFPATTTSSLSCLLSFWSTYCFHFHS